MENNQEPQVMAASAMYDYAAKLMFEQNHPDYEIKEKLVQEGMEENEAQTLIELLHNHADQAKKEAAKKDMIYGALWCVGGTAATLAEIGYIFWGAIVFGAIQFIRGLSNS